MHGKFAHQLRIKIRVILEAHGGLYKQLVGQVGAQVAVDRIGVAGITAAVFRRIAGEAVGAHTHYGVNRVIRVVTGEAFTRVHDRLSRSGGYSVVAEPPRVLSGIGARCIGIGIATSQLIGLIHIAETKCGNHRAGQPQHQLFGEVRLNLKLFIGQRAWLEGGRAVGAHGRVDGVLQGVSDFRETVARTEIVQQAGGHFSLEPGRQGVVRHLTKKARCKTAGEFFQWAVNGSILFAQIHNGAVVGVTIVEAAIGLAGGVVTKGVELLTAPEIVTCIKEQTRRL